MDSILTSIKKLLGIEEKYTQFDQDIIIHINSALMALNQLGIGPTAGFTITDDTAIWSDVLGESINLEAIKSYIYMKVRLIFDPPTSSFVLDAIDNQIKELEWRLIVQVEGGTPVA
jgi:hypothetical protein